MKVRKSRKLAICCLAILSLVVFNYKLSYSQSSYAWINRDVSTHFEGSSSVNNFLHSSVKPYLLRDVSKSDTNKRGSLDHIFHHSLLNSKNQSSWIDVGPALSLVNGYNVVSEDVYMQTFFGAVVRAGIGKRFSFSAQYMGGIGNYPSHITDKIIETEILPGSGYAYSQNNKYSNTDFEGWVSFSPSSHFNFQLGQGKNFWGDGYRSLLLSDYSSSYPFLKITTDFWKFKYVNLYAVFTDARDSEGVQSLFEKKFGSFHYLSLNLTKWLNVGLFESIVWRGRDSSGFRGYEVNYLNPIIFYRPVEFAQGSSDNSLMGANFKIGPFKKNSFYGQLILDEFLLSEIVGKTGWWGNKYGFQLGYKGFDVFGLRGFNARAEYNLVRPYTYSHGLSYQNYSHYIQPLAHPLGANFTESLVIFQYCIGDLIAELRGNYSIVGSDTGNTNWGSNIFMDYTNPRIMDFGNVTTQGVKTKIQQASVRVSWTLAHSINLRLTGQMSYRVLTNLSGSKTASWVSIGLRTDIGNRYQDF